MTQKKWWILSILLIVLILISGVAIVFVATRNNDKLVIYTYDSLLAYGDNSTLVYDEVFHQFGRDEGIEVEIVTFSSTGEMISALLLEKDNPIADIVIGVDNLDALSVLDEDIFISYNSPLISDLEEGLVDDLDKDLRLLPYDYSVIALVRNETKLPTASFPQLGDSFVLSDLTNSSIASRFVVENPLLSSPGQSFLMWQIGIYEKVLNESWKTFWEDIKNEVTITNGWSEAFDLTLTDTSNDLDMFVSYGTDGAFNDYYNYSLGKAIVSHENDKNWAWTQVEGIGIVNKTDDSDRLDLAKRFIDHFLGKDVQNYMALNQWTYPANSQVALPDVYQSAIAPDTIDRVNDLFTQEELKENLDKWLLEWKAIFDSVV